jgi:hypothetical protein
LYHQLPPYIQLKAGGKELEEYNIKGGRFLSNMSVVPMEVSSVIL